MRTRVLKAVCIVMAIYAELAIAVTANGATSPPTWITPAITGYGKVHPRPDLSGQPNPALQYHLLIDVVHVNGKPAKLSFSLDRLARLVNLFANAGVPTDHVHIIAVLDESAGLLALTNAVYRKRFHVPNPNLQLLHRLRQFGVQVLVCSQAMASAGLQDNQISPDATITLSALTDLAIYGERGYSYMRL